MTDDIDWDALPDEEVRAAPQAAIPRTTRQTGTRGRRPAAKKLDTLKAALAKEMFTTGAMMGLAMPVTGYYIGQEADNFCDAIVTLAAKKADWIDALEHIADIGPGITVGRTVLGIGCAMGADRFYRTSGESGIDPDKRAAMFLGVSAAYYAVHPDGDNAATGTGFTAPPHASYVPVA